MKPFRMLIDAYLVWFYSHFAFFILGVFRYAIVMVFISWATLLLSLPVLLLYLAAAAILSLLRLSPTLKSALFSAVCLAVTAYFAFCVVTDKGGGPDSLPEADMTYLRVAALASTALCLLLVVWLPLRKRKRQRLFPPSGSNPSLP